MRDTVAVNDNTLRLDALVVLTESLQEVYHLGLHASHHLLAVSNELDAACVPEASPPAGQNCHREVVKGSKGCLAVKCTQAFSVHCLVSFRWAQQLHHVMPGH
jgi:hypothetical protein